MQSGDPKYPHAVDQEADGENQEQNEGYFKKSGVVSIKFDSLLNDEATIHEGDPINCFTCGAFISNLSKIFYADEYRVKFAQEQPDEHAKELANEDYQANLPIINDLDAMDRVWVCEFCQTHNVIKVEDEEIPAKEDVYYMYESIESLKLKFMETDKGDDDDEQNRALIFCIDNSESMNQKLSYISSQQPGLKVDETHAGCMRYALKNQLKDLSKSSPNKLVGVVMFGAKVEIIVDNNKESINVSQEPSSDYIATLSDFEENIAQVIQSIEMKSIKETYKMIMQEIEDIQKSKGYSSIIQGLISSIILANKFSNHSTVVICTNGQIRSSIDTKTFDDAIDHCIKLATEKGIKINIATLMGVSNDIMKISKLAKKTEGLVTSVAPGQRGSELTKEVVGTDVDMKVRLHPSLKFENLEEENLYAEGSSYSKKLYQILSTYNPEFEFKIQSDEHLLKNHIDLEGVDELPFQAEICYRSIAGNTLLRVFTKLVDLPIGPKDPHALPALQPEEEIVQDQVPAAERAKQQPVIIDVQGLAIQDKWQNRLLNTDSSRVEARAQKAGKVGKAIKVNVDIDSPRSVEIQEQRAQSPLQVPSRDTSVSSKVSVSSVSNEPIAQNIRVESNENSMAQRMESKRWNESERSLSKEKPISKKRPQDKNMEIQRPLAKSKASSKPDHMDVNKVSINNQFDRNFTYLPKDHHSPDNSNYDKYQQTTEKVPLIEKKKTGIIQGFMNLFKGKDQKSLPSTKSQQIGSGGYTNYKPENNRPLYTKQDKKEQKPTSVYSSKLKESEKPTSLLSKPKGTEVSERKASMRQPQNLQKPINRQQLKMEVQSVGWDQPETYHKQVGGYPKPQELQTQIQAPNYSNYSGGWDAFDDLGVGKSESINNNFNNYQYSNQPNYQQQQQQQQQYSKQNQQQYFNYMPKKQSEIVPHYLPTIDYSNAGAGYAESSINNQSQAIATSSDEVFGRAGGQYYKKK